MAGKKTTSNQYSKAEPSFDAIRVMVVDDDIICLSIVAGMLKTWKYQVVTVKNAEDALITLRSRSNFFHLIITDVHMPRIDGFKLQEQVREEFNLPVVLMSADDKESSMLRGLEGGASFYIVKPVSYDDLKDLWQYAVSSRKGKSAAVGETGSAQVATPLRRPLKVGSISVAVVQEEKPKNRESKKKTQVTKINEVDELEKGEATLPKKSKVVWTTALHNEFLEAIRKVGLERAVPKRILEHINEPGLTRENVASHLQKYRIFLKRLMEATSSDGSNDGKNLIEKTLRSSFATGHPSLMINALEGLKGNIPLSSSFGATIFSNQQASNSNPTPELGHGKSHLGENSAYFQQPTFGNNWLYQANNGDVTCNYNIADQVGFSNGGVSSGLSGCHDLVHGKIGNMNSGYYSQGGYSATGLGRTPQFSNVSQQKNNPTFSNEGLFDQQTNNSFHGESVFAPQSAESDVYNILLNRPKNLSYVEEGAGEEVENHGHAIDSYPVEQNPFENQQYPNQIESNEGGYNTHQLDDYYPSFDPYLNEQQGGGGLLDPASYDGYPNVSPSWNQGVGDDITDFVFGPGGY